MPIRLLDITEDPTPVAEPLEEVWLAEVLRDAHANGFTAVGDHLAKGLVQRSGLEILVQAGCTLRLQAECAGCLTAFPLEVPVSFTVTLKPKPQPVQPREDEIELHEQDLDEAFYEGDSLDLKDLIREHILLSLPMAPHCSEICRGLCPVCGADLNRESCACAREAMDPRWQTLRGLIKP